MLLPGTGPGERIWRPGVLPGSGGRERAAVIRNREHYTAKVNFIDEETGKRVGTVSLQFPTIAAFDANAAAVMNNAAIAAAML